MSDSESDGGINQQQQQFESVSFDQCSIRLESHQCVYNCDIIIWIEESTYL